MTINTVCNLPVHAEHSEGHSATTAVSAEQIWAHNDWSDAKS